MKCCHCHKELPDGSASCPYCGAVQPSPLEALAEPQTSPPCNIPQMPPRPKDDTITDRPRDQTIPVFDRPRDQTVTVPAAAQGRLFPVLWRLVLIACEAAAAVVLYQGLF